MISENYANEEMKNENQSFRRRLTIHDLESFIILTDDIINILRKDNMLYDDQARLRSYANKEEEQQAFHDDRNFIIEKAIENHSYLEENGQPGWPIESFYLENLYPLQEKILAFYRMGTGKECFFYADESYPDRYLLKAFTLRILDHMRFERYSKPKKYFLTWTSPGGHDLDEWVAVACSLEELKKEYQYEIAKYGPMSEDSSVLEAYEYIEGFGFSRVEIE